MFSNYIKIAIRNLWKNKGFSFINIFGLAIGMACSLLIFLFVKDETSYDKFHKDAAHIHRIVKDFINDDGSRIPDATTPAALAPALQRQLPEIIDIARIFPSWNGSWLMKYGDKKFTEEKFWRVDSSFFDVFTFPFIEGSPTTALRDLNGIVVTETTARRYFGKQDPMGKTIEVEPGGPMIVTGVIKDVPANSHFHFDFLASFKQIGDLDSNWGRYNYYTYIRVKPGTDMASLTKKIQGIYERSQKDRYSAFYIQPLTSIHLTSHLKWELEPNGDKLYVYVFTIIGLFILLIAAINYINLATAKSALRAKEIGVRKVSGAVRSSLVKQFLLESVITCLIASVLAVVIAQSLVSTVNSIAQKELTVLGHPVIIFYVLLAALAVGLIAGLFPALYLSSFRPIAVLKGLRINQKGALNLRKTLVVIQFTISIALIIGALVIAQQVKYIQNAKLGFNKDQVMVIRNAGSLSTANRNSFLNSALQLPGVKKGTVASLALGGGFATSRLSVKGSTKEQQLNFSNVGYDYLDVVGMELKEGRGFSSKFQSDTLTNGIPGGPLEQNIGGIIINETAVREFGLSAPATGKQLLWGTDKDTSYYVTIIGVVKDFHFTSFRNEIKPFGFICVPSQQGNFTLKLSPDNIRNTVSQLGQQWKQYSSERAFDYVFLDDAFAKLYTSETRLQKLFVSLVILGILIACLGLLGLAAFAAQQRVKEIGIRKVLGASVGSVVALLSKDFLKLVIIALVLAIPVAWYYMNKWLEDFAYRIQIQWWVFVVAAAIALLIAFLTISTQAIKAAVSNPVNSLRTE